MKHRTCVVCGKRVERDRFKAPAERTTCNLPAPCRNRLVARTRRPETRLYGVDNPAWRGGLMHSQGYVYVKAPEHPRAMKNGYVKRANLVLEKKLGRLLERGEFAHHRNKNKLDDRPSNLEPMFRGAHQRLHTIGNRHWTKRRTNNTLTSSK